MKNFLKYFNSIPFPFTMYHYFPFESKGKLKGEQLASAESWDVLRSEDEHFSISINREEWLRASLGQVRKDGQDGGFIERAKEIADFLERNNIKELYSVGVGGAGLEYQIKKHLPNLFLSCTEYSTVSVDRLKKVFTEANAIEFFDIKNGEWKKLLGSESSKSKMVLMYRIDIDFSNESMREIFESMYGSGVENVLIILCGVVTFRGAINRIKNRMIWKLKRIKYAFVGYLRSKNTYPTFWMDYYNYEERNFCGLTGFILKIKK